MKAFYVFVLTIGVCLANEKVLLDSGHPSNVPIPKAPIVQTNTAAQHEKEEKVEAPVNHDETTQHSIAPEKPSTSRPAPSSTTLAPPAPVYGIGKWNVTDDKGQICILLSGEIALNFVNETDGHVETFKVPSNAPNRGNCSEECIELDLPNNSSLHLMFGKNTTASKFYLRAIKAKLSYVVGNKTLTEEFSNTTLHLFENPLEQSYYCSPTSENLIAQKPLQHLTLKVNAFQVQAFKNSASKDFDTAVNCEASHTPDIVPIIVGCALALLVILVLVAYLISRRRSQSRGYVSM